MKLFKRADKVLARHDAIEADIRRRDGAPEPAVPELSQPEMRRERVLCYSPGGGYAHDDAGSTVPRPACRGGARQYTRAVSPAQKQRAAALRPCPHCARLRESGEERAAS